jgi:guanylate kinase
MRPGEQEGREHYFVSREEFQRMIEQHKLLEHQVIHGNLYGMPRAAIETALDRGDYLIADIEPYGAAEARASYAENVVSIFIQPPSIGTLIERMRERGDSAAEIGKRLLRVPQELAFARDCDYAILNDEIERAEAKLYRIVQAELDSRRSAVQGDPVLNYQYDYQVQVVALQGDRMLCSETAQEPPTATLNGELPHAAALRCLHAALGIDADENALITTGKRDGTYLPPVCLQYHQDLDGGERVTYVYLYRLDDAFTAPPGWSWEPVEALPETVREAALEIAR